MTSIETENMSIEKADLPLSRRLIGWIKQCVLWLLLVIVVTSGIDIWRGKDIARDHLPQLEGVTLAGTEVDINTLSKNSAVLVYFWGTWCPVCNFVSPAVNQIAASYPVVSIAVSSGSDDKLNKYLQHKGYRFETINDSESLIAKDWSLSVTPTLMVFKEGKLEHFTTGFTSLPGLWWRMMFT